MSVVTKVDALSLSPRSSTTGGTHSSYYRARYYDPVAGRFLNEDPLGFGGGSIDLYGYVDSDPANFVDAFGLNQGTATAPPPAAKPPARPPVQAPSRPIPDPPLPNPKSGPSGIGKTIGNLAGDLLNIGIVILLNPVNAGDPARDFRPNNAPPCESLKQCKEQWAKDIQFCADAFPDDHEMQEACYNIADINLQRCLDGLPRTNPRPSPKRKHTP